MQEKEKTSVVFIISAISFTIILLLLICVFNLWAKLAVYNDKSIKLVFPIEETQR